ncbi:hypothetical protein CW304_02235 [Bacillus sp. UFRGS-B20]|nr:hypothetical protein CW304_02235 [Bacillus sp. UFRGS-B20]
MSGFESSQSCWPLLSLACRYHCSSLIQRTACANAGHHFYHHLSSLQVSFIFRSALITAILSSGLHFSNEFIYFQLLLQSFAAVNGLSPYNITVLIPIWR